MDQRILYASLAVGFALLVAIICAVLRSCCQNRLKCCRSSEKSCQLENEYSETVDHIPDGPVAVVTELHNYEIPIFSNYVEPEDKLTAEPRLSQHIYDVANENKTPCTYTGNAYSHITILRDGVSRRDSNIYDVTNICKPSISKSSSYESIETNNGHIDISTI